VSVPLVPVPNDARLREQHERALRELLDWRQRLPPLVPALRGDALLALACHVDEAARETGRFRLRVQGDPQLARFRELADRLAIEIEWAQLILTPSAAQLAAWNAPGSDEAVEAAIEIVDKRGREIRRLLGDGKTW
jgi:hypothetical protein